MSISDTHKSLVICLNGAGYANGAREAEGKKYKFVSNVMWMTEHEVNADWWYAESSKSWRQSALI
jgi:hypothetical protein